MAQTVRELMRETIALAADNARRGDGGPFAALIVRKGEVISTGVNRVTSELDPTAHAEINAIRAACLHVGEFQLSGLDIYTSCEPCPMCLGAVYWARLDRIFYAATRGDAAEVGFDDDVIYREICVPIEMRRVPLEQVMRDEAREVLTEWYSMPGRKGY